MTVYNTPKPAAKAHFSIPSILAIIAAVWSFRAGASFGIMLAVIAMVLGVIGALVALAPRVRGGMISILSIIAGFIGIIAAILRMIF